MVLLIFEAPSNGSAGALSVSAEKLNLIEAAQLKYISASRGIYYTRLVPAVQYMFSFNCDSDTGERGASFLGQACATPGLASRREAFDGW